MLGQNHFCGSIHGYMNLLIFKIFRKRGVSYKLGCAIKDLWGLWGLWADSESCRIVALLPVIPYAQRNNW